IDANPILQPRLPGQRLIALNDVLADDDAASRGFNRIIENRSKSIGRGFDQPSVVLENAGLYEFALDPLCSTARLFVVGWRRTGAARNIANDNCGKTAGRRLPGHAVPVRSELSNFSHGSPHY